MNRIKIILLLLWFILSFTSGVIISIFCRELIVLPIISLLFSLAFLLNNKFIKYDLKNIFRK